MNAVLCGALLILHLYIDLSVLSLCDTQSELYMRSAATKEIDHVAQAAIQLTI